MNSLLKFLCLCAIRTIKLCPSLVVTLFPGIVERIVKSELEAAGIVVVEDFDADKNENQNKNKSKSTSNEVNDGKLVMTVKSRKVYQSFGRIDDKWPMDDYVKGLWDCDQLGDLLIAMFRMKVESKKPFVHFLTYLDRVQYEILGQQDVQSNTQGCKKLYDFGNDYFRDLFGSTMKYSCALWNGDKTKDLDAAQLASMELIGRKLKLAPGMNVLYIGCGWGTLAKYLADQYKVSVVAISNSIEGVKYAQDLCQGSSVQAKCIDYRDLVTTNNENRQAFDRILTIEMIEHIGPKNYESFFNVVDHCLKPDGLVFLQLSVRERENVPGFSSWVNSAFCDNCFFPHPSEIMRATSTKFVLEDVQNLDMDYHRTIQEWLNNLDSNWPSISKKYGDEAFRIFRTWKLFFSMAMGFKSREMHLWHLMLAKTGNKNFTSYRPER